MSFGVIPFDPSFPNTKAIPVGADILFGYDTDGEVNAKFPLSGIKSYIGGGDWNTMANKPTSFPPSAHTLGSHSNVNNAIDSATMGQLVRMGASGFEAFTPNYASADDIPNVPAWVLGITEEQPSNWDEAFGWGDHAEAGYLTSFTETDPVFGASPAAGIEGTDISNWDTAFGWGDHADAGYLTSFTETDPVFLASPAYGITTGHIGTWNAKALEYSSFADNIIPIIRDGIPLESGILGVYTENPYEPEDPEYDTWEPELLHFQFPVKVKGVGATEPDELMTWGQFVHNDAQGVQGGDESGAWHNTHQDYLKVLKLIANISANSVSQRGLTTFTSPTSADSTNWKWIVNNVEYSVVSETNVTEGTPAVYPTPDFFVGTEAGEIDYRRGIIDQFGNPVIPYIAPNEVLLDVVIRDPDGNNHVIPPDVYFDPPFPNILYQTAVQENTTGLYAKVWSATILENGSYGLDFHYFAPSSDADWTSPGKGGRLNAKFYFHGGTAITAIKLETFDSNSEAGDWVLQRVGTQVTLYHKSTDYWMRVYYRGTFLAGGAVKQQIFNRQIYEALPSSPDQQFESVRSTKAVEDILAQTQSDLTDLENQVQDIEEAVEDHELRIDELEASALDSDITEALNASLVDSPNSANRYVTVSLLNSHGYVQEAPINGNHYARKDGEWVAFTPFAHAPSDGSYYASRNGAWASFVPFVVAGTPTDGYVVGSVSGVATWVAPSGGGGGNFIAYDVAQSLTASEKLQARTNIGSTSVEPQIVSTSGDIDGLVATSNTIHFTGSSVVIKGIVPQHNGHEIVLVNRTSSLITIDNFAASTSSNSFYTNFTIPPYGIVRIKYNGATGFVSWFVDIAPFSVPSFNSNSIRVDMGISIGRYLADDARLELQGLGDGNTPIFRVYNLSGSLLFDIKGNGVYNPGKLSVYGAVTEDSPLTVKSGGYSIVSLYNSAGSRRLNIGNGGMITSLTGAYFGSPASYGFDESIRLRVRGVGTTTNITQLLETSGGVANARFYDNGNIDFLRLPTSDPLVAGRLYKYNDGTRDLVAISAG